MIVREPTGSAESQDMSAIRKDGETAFARLVTDTFFMKNLEGTVIATSAPTLADPTTRRRST